MSKGLRRKELRQPDEFLTLSKRFLDYAKEHEREVTFAILGVVVLAAAALGVRTYRGWQESKAEAVFGAARQDFSTQNFDTAASAFARVSTTWPSTAHGQLALVYLGNSYAELGKTKEAEDAFRRALAVTRDDVVRQIAHYNLGVLGMKDGDDKAAAAAQLSTAAGIEGPLRGVAWFARLSSQQQSVEKVNQDLLAVNDLPPDAREYAEARIAKRAKSEQ